MKAKQLRTLTTEKLKERLASLKKEVNDLLFDIKIGEVKDYSTAKKKKIELARVMTVLNDNAKSEVQSEISKVKEKKSSKIKEVESKKVKDDSKDDKKSMKTKESEAKVESDSDDKKVSKPEVEKKKIKILDKLLKINKK